MKPTAEPPGPGRPPIEGKSADAIIRIRLTHEKKNRYVKTAQRVPGRSLTEWIKEVLDKEAIRRQPEIIKRKVTDGIVSIEKGVNIPSISGQGRKSKWNALFKSWEIGDSFEIEFSKSTLFHKLAISNKQKITVRTIRKGYVRIWRVE